MTPLKSELAELVSFANVVCLRASGPRKTPAAMKISCSLDSGQELKSFRSFSNCAMS